MTIHQAKRRKTDMTIPDNLTLDAADFWKGITAGTVHPLPCQCDLCLYSLYKKRKRGRPFGRLMFFVNWLINRVKMDYLIDNGKAERIRTYEGKRWRVKIKDYMKAPYSRKVSTIISDLIGNEILEDISIDLENIYLHVYKKRTEKISFVKLIDDLTMERYWQWLKTRPDIEKARKENWEHARFCQKIVDFIESRQGQKATQRDLERHFSNKRKADLERAFEWLWFYPNLRRRKKGKSVIFYWKRPTAAEIEAYNQKEGVKNHGILQGIF